jgi:1,4-dihydroxy-6-naphthoate synthase
MPFHDIENAVLSGAVDAGVIIHENRFTYAERGLFLLSDLGKVWENKTNAPIPLGGIVVHKSVPMQVQVQIDTLVKKSLQFAKNRLPVLSPYIEFHAQEMEPIIMKKHIELYVNHYSESLGEKGLFAIAMLLKQFDLLQALKQETAMPNVVGK